MGKYTDFGRYFLRNQGEIAEIEARIVDFYTLNGHQKIADPLKLRSYIKAIEDNKAFYIDDENGEMVSNSFCFPFCDGSYTETGGTRVILNGFGLQIILLSARVVSEYLVNTPEVIFCVTSNNERSNRNIEKSGFEKWLPPSELSQERDSKLGVDPNRVYFKIPHLEGNSFLTDIDIKNSAQRMINLYRQPVLQRAKRGDNHLIVPEEFETIHLVLDIPVMTDPKLRDVVESLANS